MFWQLKKTVTKEILIAERDKDKQSYNGHIILIDKKYQLPKKWNTIFLN